MIFVVVLSLVAATTNCNFYRVPSYYGYWNRNYFLYENITQGRLRLLEMQGQLDAMPNSSTVFYAEADRHVIRKVNLTNDTMEVFAGTLDRAGTRVGSPTNTLFNNPTGVAYYCEDDDLGVFESELAAVVTRDQHCNTEDIGCVLTQDEALTINLSLNNIRFVTQGQSVDQTQFYKNLSQKSCAANSKEYLFVSDTNNHCIKRINLKLKLVEVVAGKCRTSGFQDGPKNFNVLNKPTTIGVTHSGQVVFLDSGNEYMRVLYPNGTVATLLNGACTEYPGQRTIKQYKIRMVLCYLDWLQLAASAGNKHLFRPQSTTGTCTNHYSKC